MPGGPHSAPLMELREMKVLGMYALPAEEAVGLREPPINREKEEAHKEIPSFISGVLAPP